MQESRERVRAAIKNAGFPFPASRITINLAPADLRLRVPFAATSEMVANKSAAPDHKFPVLQAEVQSVNLARGVSAGGDFIFEAGGYRYEPASATLYFQDECDYPSRVPVGGSRTCPLVFEIPATVYSGSLHFDDSFVADLVQVPAFQAGAVPFAPDVELEVLSAWTQGWMARRPPCDGDVFLVLEARVRGVNVGHFRPYVPFRAFELESEGTTFSESYRSHHLSSSCDTVLEYLPGPEGATCTLVFEVPRELSGGVLRYQEEGYADEVAFDL